MIGALSHYLSQGSLSLGAERSRGSGLRAALFCAVVSLSSLGLARDAMAQDSFTVLHAETSLVNKVYHLSAEMEYKLNDDVRDAVNSGVPLILVMDIELYKPRHYIWDKEVAELQQRYKLQYHAVAEQYIISNLNSGAQSTYHTLTAAFDDLRDLHDIPIIDGAVVLEVSQ